MCYCLMILTTKTDGNEQIILYFMLLGSTKIFQILVSSYIWINHSEWYTM